MMSNELKPFDLVSARIIADEAPKLTDYKNSEAYILPALYLKMACDEIERLRNTRAEPRCPCGGVIYANSEDWKVPVCYECFEEIREYLIGFIKRTEAEPRCDQCKYYDHSMCDYFDQLVMRDDFCCNHFERKENE